MQGPKDETNLNLQKMYTLGDQKQNIMFFCGPSQCSFIIF